jgi:hypothetical protein
MPKLQQVFGQRDCWGGIVKPDTWPFDVVYSMPTGQEGKLAPIQGRQHERSVIMADQYQTINTVLDQGLQSFEFII